MEQVLDRETAELEIAGIAEEFDIKIEEEAKETLIKSVMEGRLYLEGDQIVYKLARPTDQITEMKFSEPTGAQSERAAKGIKATQKNGVTEIDIGESSKMSSNLASAMTGIAVGQIMALKNRDKKIVDAIVGFFS